jgi:hypothetical protein
MPSSAILIFAAWYWAHGADEVLVRTVFGTLVVTAIASGLFFMKVTNLRAYASLEPLFTAGRRLQGVAPEFPRGARMKALPDPPGKMRWYQLCLR